MKRLFLILVALNFLGIAACNNADRPPKDILSKEKMINILLDMHLAESHVNTLGINRDSARFIFQNFEKEIYEKHQVEESTYLDSYTYYLSQVKDFDEIYGAVVDSLSLKDKLINLE